MISYDDLFKWECQLSMITLYLPIAETSINSINKSSIIKFDILLNSDFGSSDNIINYNNNFGVSKIIMKCYNIYYLIYIICYVSESIY